MDLILTLNSIYNDCACKRIHTTGLGQLLSCALSSFRFHFRSEVTQPPHSTQASSVSSRVLHGSCFANLHPSVPAVLKTASHPFSDSSTNCILHPSRPAITWYRCPTRTRRKIRHEITLNFSQTSYLSFVEVLSATLKSPLASFFWTLQDTFSDCRQIRCNFLKMKVSWRGELGFWEGANKHE